MSKPVSAPLKNADDIILTRCRAYVYRKHYLQLVVFSTWWSEVESVSYSFGGHIYKHGTGFIWILAKRDSILALVTHLKPFFPSFTGFESKVLDIYPLEKYLTT